MPNIYTSKEIKKYRELEGSAMKLSVRGVRDIQGQKKNLYHHANFKMAVLLEVLGKIHL